MYIYIYREREIEIYMYAYIYIYMCERHMLRVACEVGAAGATKAVERPRGFQGY